MESGRFDFHAVEELAWQADGDSQDGPVFRMHLLSERVARDDGALPERARFDLTASKRWCVGDEGLSALTLVECLGNAAGMEHDALTETREPALTVNREDSVGGDQHCRAAEPRPVPPTVTIIGDFADARSFLASQRVTQIVSLGLLAVRWCSVESERSRPMSGWRFDDATARTVSDLSLAGECAPAAGLMVPNSRAATAAYAESVADGVPDEMRRALFDALWNDRRRVDDPDVIRSIVSAVVDPMGPHADLRERVRSSQPLVRLGDPDSLDISRRLGFTVSMGRGPLTLAGQRRIDAWREVWEDHARPRLPLLLTEVGEVLAGDQALSWLTNHLPHLMTAEQQT